MVDLDVLQTALEPVIDGRFQWNVIKKIRRAKDIESARGLDIFELQRTFLQQIFFGKHRCPIRLI